MNPFFRVHREAFRYGPNARVSLRMPVCRWQLHSAAVGLYEQHLSTLLCPLCITEHLGKCWQRFCLQVYLWINTDRKEKQADVG